MKVPLERAEFEVVHFVASDERGCREGWQVKQIPLGPEQLAQVGSQA